MMGIPVIGIVAVVVVIVVKQVVLLVVVTVSVRVVSVRAVVGDAGLAEGDQRGRLLPVADAIHLGAVVLVHAVASVGDADDGPADVPAAVGDVLAVEFRGEDDVAGQHEAGEREKLGRAHGGGGVGVRLE